MRVIPIPPLSMTAFMELSDAQLMLPLTEILKDTRYARCLAAATQRSDYLILDNGEAEGKRIDWKHLLSIAEAYGVSEIVLPDVMGNAEETLQAIKQVWFGRPQQYRYMGVAQGENGTQVREMIEYLISLGVQTIGLPRHMVRSRPQARLEILQWMTLTGQDTLAEIHLLGMNPTFPGELELIRQEGYSDVVRSVDTSMPFVAALANRELRHNQDILPPRPEGYFLAEFTEEQTAQAMRNLRWLRGEPITE